MWAGVAEDRVALIPNGCDLEIFSEPVLPWRPDGVRMIQLLAVFTGTHGQANGLDGVLKSRKGTEDRQRDDICIALVGKGGEKLI